MKFKPTSRLSLVLVPWKCGAGEEFLVTVQQGDDHRNFVQSDSVMAPKIREKPIP